MFCLAVQIGKWAQIKETYTAANVIATIFWDFRWIDELE
jgi:hypothetical protein